MLDLDEACGEFRVAPRDFNLCSGALAVPFGAFCLSLSAFRDDQRAERVDIIRQIGGFVGHVPILCIFAACFQPSIQSQNVAASPLHGRVMLKTCLWHGNPAQ